VGCLVALLVCVFVISLISPSIGATIASTSMCVAMVGLAIVWLAARDRRNRR
jgi:hypothetical protein